MTVAKKKTGFATEFCDSEKPLINTNFHLASFTISLEINAQIIYYDK